MTSAIIKGTGSKSNTLHICIVTGTISNIVVTLSRRAEKKAVIIHNMNVKRHIEPPL